MEDTKNWQKNGCETFNPNDMSTASTSVAQKRAFPFDNDIPSAKRKCENIDQASSKTEIYTPISTLSQTTKTRPIIKGTLLSVSPWLTIPNGNLRHINFRLKDESGEIPGIVYEPMNEVFTKTFTPGAEIIIEKPQIHHIPGTTQDNDRFQLVINKWTLIKIKPIETESSTTVEPLGAKTTESHLDSVKFKKPFPKLGKSAEVTKDSRLLCDNSQRNRTLIRTVIERIDNREIVDVMGILQEIGDVCIVENDEGSFMSRQLRIIDESKQSINVQLWKDEARNFDSPVGVVIAINKITVHLYGDVKTLISNPATEMTIDPATPEAQILKKWHREAGDESINRKVTSEYLPNPLSYGTLDNHEGSSLSEIEFLPIKYINESSEDEDIVGTIGLVVKKGNVKEKKLKNGQKQWTRSIQLSDGEGSEIRVNVHGDRIVEDESIPLRSIMLIRKAKLRDDFDLKILNCLCNYVVIDPDIPEAHRMRELCWKNGEEVKAKNKPIIEQANQIQFLSLSAPKNGINEDISTMPKISSITETSSEDLPISGVINFTTIQDIVEEKDIGSIVDVIGIAVSIDKPLVTMNGKKEVILLRDYHGDQIFLVIGGSNEGKPIERYSVLCVMNGELKLFDGEKVLCCLRSSIKINPDMPEAQSLEKARTMAQTWLQALEHDDPPCLESSDEEIDESKVQEKVEEMNEEVEAPKEIKVQNESKNNSPQSFTESIDNCTPISDIIDHKSPGNKINVIGVAVEVSETECSKFGVEGTSMQRIVLMDETEREIDVSVWGSPLKDSIITLNSVLLVKDAVVRVKNDVKQLMCLYNRVIVDPEPSEIHRLKGLPPIVPLNDNVSKAPLEENAFNPAVSRMEKTFNNNVSANQNSLMSKPWRSINEIKSIIAVGAAIDFIGIMVENRTPQSRQTQYGQIVTEVVLTDDRCSEITLAILGPIPQRFNIVSNTVFAAKNATVVLFNNVKRLKCALSNVTIDPPLPEADRLRNLPPYVADVPQMAYKSLPTRIETSSKSNISATKVPQVPSKYRSINEINSIISLRSKIDFIGIVVSIGALQSRLNRCGKEMTVTEITLTDDRSSEIVAAVWGPGFDPFQLVPNSILSAKNATVIEWNYTRRLNCLRAEISIDPDIPEAHRLKELLNVPQCTKTSYNTVAVKSAVETTCYNNSNLSAVPNPPVNNCYRSIEEIMSTISVGSAINVMGFIVAVRDPIIRKTQRGIATTMTEVILKDSRTSNDEIVLVVWGAEIDKTKIHKLSVLVAKDAKVISFNERKRLSCLRISVAIDPDIPEVHSMKARYMTGKTRIPHSPLGETAKSNCCLDPTVKTRWKDSGANVIIRHVPLQEIAEKYSPGNYTNVLGIVTKSTRLQSILVRGKYSSKITVTLLDESEKLMTMTIWGTEAENIETDEYPIIEALNVTVHQYKDDKQLTCSENKSTVNFEPPGEEARKLREWFNIIGKDKLIERKLRCQEFPTQITFTPIGLIKRTLKDGEKTNVFAYVLDVDDIQYFPNFFCREALIVDESRSSIRLTLFGRNALVIKKNDCIIAAVNVIVRLRKQELDLACTDKISVVYVDPDVEKSEKLKSWYKSNSTTNPFASSILPITPNNLVFKNLGASQKTSIVGVLMKKHDMETVKGRVMDISRKITMIDDNENTITFVIFGERARHFDFAEGSILLVTHLYVFRKGQHEGCFCSDETNFVLNPNDPEVEDNVKKLKLWLSNNGAERFQDRFEVTIAPIAVGDVVNSTMIGNDSTIAKGAADKAIVSKVKDEPISQEAMEVEQINCIRCPQASFDRNTGMKKIFQPKVKVEEIVTGDDLS